ncbi:maleylpyruvate isomerase N-terminal domain-containing protein [Streptomyces atriruber]|uniref:maleylpyruvate isomerase N-terminal domain-containing protein n=1 Tax=Streptomyces atriruber TaxID=545121 RepID=UPI003F53EEC7
MMLGQVVHDAADRRAVQDPSVTSGERMPVCCRAQGESTPAAEAGFVIIEHRAGTPVAARALDPINAQSAQRLLHVERGVVARNRSRLTGNGLAGGRVERPAVGAPHPAPGWSVAHQIAHLAWTDHPALPAATDTDAFNILVEKTPVSPGSFVDDGAEEDRYAAVEFLALLAQVVETRASDLTRGAPLGHGSAEENKQACTIVAVRCTSRGECCVGPVCSIHSAIAPIAAHTRISGDER